MLCANRILFLFCPAQLSRWVLLVMPASCLYYSAFFSLVNAMKVKLFVKLFVRLPN